MPGGGDPDLSDVDTVVSAAISGCMCDLDRVSRGDIVVSLDDMSLSGGVDECVWCQFGVGSCCPRPVWC